MTQAGPWRLKEITPGTVRERFRQRPTLLVPVGATEQHGPHLPFGCDTIIVERLADDLSARHGVVRAPAIEFGVHSGARPLPGGAVLRRRTLHRVMNELIESWEEEAGVREFVVLTAQADDAHLEALSTIRTDGATVQVMDIFSMDFGSLLERPGVPRQGGELNTSLLLHLAPDLVRMELISGGAVGYPTIASAQKGARLYRFILDRISTCLDRA
jgi:creatinine amidohydrolase/Fe(II)-dependent formamide hydrolase-like protein